MYSSLFKTTQGASGVKDGKNPRRKKKKQNEKQKQQKQDGASLGSATAAKSQLAAFQAAFSWGEE